MSETTAQYLVPERISARERLLGAADELFYEEGINTVGIDRVIERAGVAKASLYNIFGSKEELIRAYLDGKHAARVTRITSQLQRFTTPRDRLLGLFDLQAESAADPGFRGCAFVRANVEMRNSLPVASVCERTRTWLRDLFRQLAEDAGVARAGELAAQLALLYDGATVAAQLDHDRDAPLRARQVAGTLLDAALTSTAA
jgi:AcrR family transcriptional regulator